MVRWISGYVKLFYFVMLSLFTIFSVYSLLFILRVYYILLVKNTILSTSGPGHSKYNINVIFPNKI